MEEEEVEVRTYIYAYSNIGPTLSYEGGTFTILRGLLISAKQHVIRKGISRGAELSKFQLPSTFQ